MRFSKNVFKKAAAGGAGAFVLSFAVSAMAQPTKLTAPAGDDAQPAPTAVSMTKVAPTAAAAPAVLARAGDNAVSVAVNKSRIVNAATPFHELSVGNSDIADVVPLSRQHFYVLGKKIGSTNIVMTDARGQVIDVIDVDVGYDVDGLKRKIYEVAPDADVEIRAANDSILLSGSVADAAKASAIAALADRYAPGRVTNMIGVKGSQQVMLQVRFAEVQRSVLKDISSQLQVTDLDGGGFMPQLGLPGEFGARTLDGLNPTDFFAGGATLVKAGDFALSAMFDVLEQKGLVRTLAEPNMVALSGDTASFLAGGEFPIPVAQATNGGGTLSAITVEFKEFGVGLSFTPTVAGKDSINLELVAEVSAIDPSVSTTLGSITIPGLKVRRTNTTVELRDGQSFAIAGLMQDDLTEEVRQIPGLGSVPIIGALARSSNFERRQTELVVLITARLVKPVKGDKLAQPTDSIVPPNERDFFLLGKTEKVIPPAGAGGVDGKYGYQQP
ncbi:MAG TPA: type II and III secretion system protein family protein [Parvularculaceae bacterium]|nr:type II and III secretion system protein family protein [Parvularculaceae bacterium]